MHLDTCMAGRGTGAAAAERIAFMQAGYWDQYTGAAANRRTVEHPRNVSMLLDGRVLIAGGLRVTPTVDELGSAEIYQP